MDVDGSGTISRLELRRVLTELGDNSAPEQIDALFQQMDLDGGGKIEYKELHKLLR